MIRNITVYLDSEPEGFMERVRCGFIVAENDAGEETFHNDVIDNSEYSGLKELIDEVAGIFKISREMIVVTA